jgi:hypothetical protein
MNLENEAALPTGGAGETPELVLLALEKVQTDGGTHMRVEVDQFYVDELSAHIQGGERLPPVVVFRDEEGDHWLMGSTASPPTRRPVAPRSSPTFDLARSGTLSSMQSAPTPSTAEGAPTPRSAWPSIPCFRTRNGVSGAIRRSPIRQK